MIRSGYSFHVAAGHLKDVVSRAREIGLPALPLTDRASTFGFVELSKLCKDGIRPIYGVELAVVPKLGELKIRPDFWKFLAVDSLQPLHDLILTATQANGKEPHLSYDEAHDAEGVIKISGERVLLDHVDPHDPDFFFGLSPATPIGTYRRASKMDLSMCAISDNFFPRKDDLEFYRVMLGGRSGTTTYPQWILSEGEWRLSVDWFANSEDMELAIQNQRNIINSCHAELRTAKLLVADKPLSLREMCERGAAGLGCDLTNPVYAERLDRELAMIESKNFSDYFHIIADAIAFAKTKMIVGPARGSSCGSLVCYLIGITSVDPIPHDLIFERFIDVNRADLPDIDIDFSDARRHLVFEYMAKKYGKDRIARLGSVMTMGVASALNRIGTSLKIPSWIIEKVSDGAIKRLAGDSRASSTIEDTIMGTDAGAQMMKEYPEAIIVTRMEDHPVSASQHAAGVLLTDEPIMNFVAVNAKSGAAMVDKKAAESLNLLKIDALGLTQLSIFERVLELIGEKPVSVNGYLERIPLDDPEAFRVLNERRFTGIFQFTGAAVKGITEQITVENIDDMISITALARPGPLASGGTDDWIQRRIGKVQINYRHPSLEKYCGDTQGCIIYQEQVMRICREIGDLSWEDVSALRRAMSRSLGLEFFDQYGDKWKAAAISKGWTPEDANMFWGELVQFGAMGFNKSHSVAYGLISYWCCYLKAHFPMEYAAASLDMEDSDDKQIAMLRELAREGIQYVAVDPEHSTDKWVPVVKDNQRYLVGPLTNIQGFGPKTVAKVLDARRLGIELTPAVKKGLMEAKTNIDSLTPVADAIKRLWPDLREAKIFSEPLKVEEIKAGETRGEFIVLVRARKAAPTDENAAVKVTKRKGKKLRGLVDGVPVDGAPAISLNMFVGDDTDEIFAKINHRDFEALAKRVTDNFSPNKSLYVIKGTCPEKFRMISVSAIKYLGRMDEPNLILEEEAQ